MTRDSDSFRLAKPADLPRLSVVKAARFAPYGTEGARLSIITLLTIAPAFFSILSKLATRDLYTSGRNEYVTTSPNAVKMRTGLIVFAPVVLLLIGVLVAATQLWFWWGVIFVVAVMSYGAPVVVTTAAALRDATLGRALSDQRRAMREDPGYRLGAANAPGSDKGTIDRFSAYLADHPELHPCYVVAAVDKLAGKYVEAGMIPIGSTGLSFRSPSQQERDDFERDRDERAG